MNRSFAVFHRNIRVTIALPFAVLLGAACGVEVDDPVSGAEAELGSASSSLGSASSFAILAGPAVTCTTSEVTGDVGAGFPGAPVTQGLCPVTGTVHAGDVTAAQAYNDFILAYDAVAEIDCPADPAFNLTGTLADVTLTPGVYCFDAAAALTGELTLDALGDANATWLIKVGAGPIGGALTTTDFSVLLANGANACNVTWWIAGAATVTRGAFKGTVLAGAGFTATGDAAIPASFVGRAFAQAAATITDMSPFGGCTTAAGPGGCKRKGDRVTGGGWISLAGGKKGTFAVSGGIKSGAYHGQLEYDAHSSTGPKVKGTGVTQYLVVDADTRHIEGTAKVNGVSGFTYQVDASDNKGTGFADTFAINLRNGAGTLVYSASGSLKGGNITIHKAKSSGCGHGQGHDNDGDDDDDEDEDD